MDQYFSLQAQATDMEWELSGKTPPHKLTRTAALQKIKAIIQRKGTARLDDFVKELGLNWMVAQKLVRSVPDEFDFRGQGWIRLAKK